jgi:hypothetical protein
MSSVECGVVDYGFVGEKDEVMGDDDLELSMM